MFRIDHREPSPGGKGVGDEVMTVARPALDGEERISRQQAARIDRQAADPGWQRADDTRLHGGGERVAGPEYGHRRASCMAARAT
jgi:hypothetical protein